ncbi:hypothetical protein HMSP1_95 [Sinorhizobium phage HMSP1-Susan]|nr:hypothetical protein HMSP1_95 [Sinorhizobium phage HMSP1-Susan]
METVHDGPLTESALGDLQYCIHSNKPWRGYIVTYVNMSLIYPDFAVDLSRVIVKGRKLCDN